jgi:hypothetical protein
VHCFLASCLVVMGHCYLDASFFKNFQDLEAEDFEQQQGARGKFYLLCFHTLMLYFCLHAVKSNLLCHAAPCVISCNLIQGGVSG